eukprot:gnl/MRDRNA2_/MRDRNA2_146398_c0_seq1.p1 gnl/MRDRNA2_/MRDRNA2_146398_c0~~gnl/MRDRNA2_/MRDRNA2_146398_c0_seq1.p1  ORF type:complete len:508 (-),score=82.20 gnl/MRDRNA2_/MRDRNA2_146398_c0_seq1:65-1588(-)
MVSQCHLRVCLSALSIFVGLDVSSGAAPAYEYKSYKVGDVENMNVLVAGLDTAKYRFICLHGFPEHSHSWGYFLLPELSKLLNDDIQMIAPDMRGVNRTSVKEYDPSMYGALEITRDIGNLWTMHFKKEGMEGFWLLAHDWGASIGWTYAGMDPMGLWESGLKGYVSMTIPHLNVFGSFTAADPSQAAASSYMGMWGRGAAFSYKAVEMQGFAPFKAQFLTVPNFGAVSSAYTDAWGFEDSLMYHMLWYGNVDTMLRRRLQAMALPVPRVPSLLLWGAKDFALLQDMICCNMEHVKDLQFRMMDTTHWVFQEDPVGTARAIAEFVGVSFTDNSTSIQPLTEYCAAHPEQWTDHGQAVCKNKAPPLEQGFKSLATTCQKSEAETCPSIMTHINCLTEVFSASCVSDFCEDLSKMRECATAAGVATECQYIVSLNLFLIGGIQFCGLSAEQLQTVQTFQEQQEAGPTTSAPTSDVAATTTASAGDTSHARSEAVEAMLLLVILGAQIIK